MLDLVLLGLIAVSTVFGLMRGLVGTLASIAAWLLAGWFAFHFGSTVAGALSNDGAPTTTELFTGYALSFIGVMIFVGLVGWLVKKIIGAIGLSGVDRLLGGALGVVRGALVACAVVLVLGFTSIPRDEAWQRSQVVAALLPGAQLLRAALPQWVGAEVDFGKDGAAGDNSGVHDAPIPLDEGVQ